MPLKSTFKPPVHKLSNGEYGIPDRGVGHIVERHEVALRLATDIVDHSHCKPLAAIDRVCEVSPLELFFTAKITATASRRQIFNATGEQI